MGEYPDDEDFSTMWARVMNEPRDKYIPDPRDYADSPEWDNSARRIVESYLERDSKNKLLVGTPEFRPEDDFWAMVDRGEMTMIPDYILDEFRGKE